MRDSDQMSTSIFCLQNDSVPIRKKTELIINEGGLGGDKLAFCKTSAIAACDVAGVWIMPETWVS